VIQAADQPRSQWAWPLVVAIIGLYLILAMLIDPGADTLWRLHIAQSVLDGKVLYRDIIEVNPPLWFWGALPAAALGGYPALVGINLAATLTGLGLFMALVRHTLGKQGQWAATLGLAAGLCLVNVAEIGQREQAFLLACALWSALAAARIDGKQVPLWVALLVTLFSAYGFALKHYFVLVPIAIELVIIGYRRRTWNPFRPENLLLAALAIAYALAVVYLTPDYLGRVLELVQASYSDFGVWSTLNPAQDQWRLFLQCCCFACVIFAAVFTRKKPVLVHVLLMAWAISVVVVVLQQRGWRYHLIGANGLGLIILLLLWRGNERVGAPWPKKLFVMLGLGGLLWTAIAQPIYTNLKSNGQPLNTVLAGIIASQPRDHHIAILSTAPDHAFFPLARAKRAHWSRHFSMWMMQGLMTPKADPDKEAARRVETSRVLKEFAADLTCRPPDIIVGEAGVFRNAARTPFDAMAFLAQDPAFAAWIAAHYRRAPDIGRYPVWRLAGTKPSPQNCAMAL
jgi:hypothetical protein